MRRTVERIMASHGREITTLCGGVKTVVRGFLQPVTGKAERLAKVEQGPLGRESRAQFIYIGPAEPQLQAGDCLAAEGKTYHVRSGQILWIGDEAIYCWAMCTEKGGDDSWGQSG